MTDPAPLSAEELADVRRAYEDLKARARNQLNPGWERSLFGRRAMAVAKAHAAARRSAPAAEWRGMESAPRDGSIIAVWRLEGQRREFVHYYEERNGEKGWSPVRPGCLLIRDNPLDIRGWLFAPLPPPPALAQSEGAER